MILNFPISASTGDTYTSNNATYTYNGYYWEVSGTTLAAIVATNATTGSNTFNGNQYINGSITLDTPDTNLESYELLVWDTTTKQIAKQPKLVGIDGGASVTIYGTETIFIDGGNA